MLKLQIGTNTEKRTIIVEESATPFSTLQDEGVNTTNAVTYMSGSILDAKDMNKTFAELGVVSRGTDSVDATLFAIVKASSAR